jgi:iron complex outermembrane receptor protein
MLLAGVGSVLALTGGQDARAQTTLPEVVVTAPSPIQRPRPARVPAATPAPAEAPSAPEPAPLADVYPVVGDSFSPVTVIPSPQILRTPAATLGDTLFTTPGVTGNTFAPGASRPVIRGLDNARVRVQENGIGAMDVSTISEDHAVPIDPLTTDKIEVIRGPATLRWGPSAIGGVVATSSNRIPDPMTPTGFNLVTKGALSAVDKGREAATILDGRWGNWAVHSDYARRKTEDYAIPGGGRQANSAVSSESMAVGASYIFNDGFIGMAVSHLNSLYGIPGIESAQARTRIDLQQTRITSRGEFRTGGSIVDTVRFWLGATAYKHDERSLDGAADTVMATFKNREFEGRGEVQFVPMATGLGVLNTAFGLQGGQQRLGTSGEAGSLLAPSQTDRSAAYLFNELTVSPTLRLQAAGRLGHQSVGGTAALFPANLLPDANPVPEQARRRTVMPGSASFGVLKDLPLGLVATGTVNHSERAPEAQELFSKGPHEASGTFEIGNPNLGKEAATAFEIGLKRPRGDFRFEATAFHTRYRGFIYKRLTGNSCGEEFATCIAGPGEELRQVAFDQKDATFTGAELSGQFDLLPVAGGTFGIDGQYDFVHAKFSDGSYVPRIPPHRLGGGLYWRDGHWFLRVNLLHAFAQNDLAAEETPTAGYNLLNATASYTHRFRSGELPREMTVGVQGINLLDDDMRNHVSFKKDEVLLPGRNLRFFATLRF